MISKLSFEALRSILAIAKVEFKDIKLFELLENGKWAMRLKDDTLLHGLVKPLVNPITNSLEGHFVAVSRNLKETPIPPAFVKAFEDNEDEKKV